MKHVWWMIVLVLAVVSGVNAQDEWQVLSGQDTRALFEGNVRGVSLSPDGAMLAGEVRDSICTLHLATEESKCYPMPEDFGGNLGAREHFNPLVWSPDSSQLAFTENFYINYVESDVWVLDVLDGTYTNRTDDSVAGGVMRLDDAEYTLDYLPAYAPNGDLYFFRTVSDEARDGDYTLTLQRLEADADEPEQVADLTDTLPVLSIFYAPAVSPDGTQIAFPVQAREYDEPRNGLWIVDLTTGEARQLTDSADAAAGMPEAAQELANQTQTPVWLPDGSGIVFKGWQVEAYNQRFAVPPQAYLYVDVATGEVTPLFDLSDFPEGAAAFQRGDDGTTAFLSLPREGAVSADGSSFVYMRYDMDLGTPQLAVVALPPDGGEPVELGDVDFDMAAYTSNPRMSSDNTVLLAGWLYTVEPAG